MTALATSISSAPRRKARLVVRKASLKTGVLWLFVACGASAAIEPSPYEFMFLVARVKPGGLLVLSGILAPAVADAQLSDVRAAYGAMREERVVTRGEWVAVVLRNAS